MRMEINVLFIGLLITLDNYVGKSLININKREYFIMPLIKHSCIRLHYGILRMMTNNVVPDNN